MQNLIENILQSDWESTQQQHHIIDWSMDLTNRCSELRTPAEIGNNPLIILTGENGQEIDLKEDQFWRLVVTNEELRNGFLFGRFPEGQSAQ